MFNCNTELTVSIPADSKHHTPVVHVDTLLARHGA
jgi:hypothetical protein